MGKCITCGCDTDDFRCRVRLGEDGEKYDDYKCEDCVMKTVLEERRKNKEKFNKIVLPYILENNFKVIVKGGMENKEEIFEIKNSDIMYPVDIIRKDMESKGYYENWIDIHREEYQGITFEVVEYLCYALPGKDDTEWVSYYLELVGDKGLKFKEIYN